MYVLIILASIVMRLIPHEPNMAPIGALAIFSGVYLSRKKALFIPLAAMFLSDLFLGFYREIGWVYGSFALIGLLSAVILKKNHGVKNIIAFTLFSSLLFYLLTNFGVWLQGTMYAKNIPGLIQCYVLALPFLRNTIIGDMVYVGVFFGAFNLSQNFSMKLLALRKPN